MPTAVIYICAAMLFVGAAPLPYGYYTLLRLVACGVFAFAAFVSFDRKHKTLPWVYVLLALLFNPIIKVHLPKEAWAFVDVAAAIMLLATAKAVKSNA
jgi:prepilin signal peptidase PulO-like enzyme (type II secretory pathway)